MSDHSEYPTAIAVAPAIRDPQEFHPCTFASVGMHEPQHLNEFHNPEGPTVMVEWTWDEAIFARGMRSWVCSQYVAMHRAMGLRQDFVAIEA